MGCNAYSTSLLYRFHMNRDYSCYHHVLREINFDSFGKCFPKFICAQILVLELVIQLHVEYLLKMCTLISSLKGNMEEMNYCAFNLSIHSCWNPCRKLGGE